MNKCPHCGHENRVGELICANCGKSMAGEVEKNTHQLGEDSTEKIAKEAKPSKAAEAAASGENAYFPQSATLRLEIIGSPMPIKVKFTKETLTLGRRDPATGSLPDVDLAPFAGYRMGVSRRHSEIRRNEDGNLELLDLGSSNGTFLNGRRLTPHTPYLIQNRDRMALGQIVMEVIYQVDTSDIANAQTGQTSELVDPTQPARPSNDASYLTQPKKPEKLAEALESAKLAQPQKPKNQTRMLDSSKADEKQGKEAATKPVDQDQVKKVKDLTSKLVNSDEMKIKKDEKKGEKKPASGTLGETRDVDQVPLTENERDAIFGNGADKKDEKKPVAETVKLEDDERKAEVDDIKKEHEAKQASGAKADDRKASAEKKPAEKKSADNATSSEKKSEDKKSDKKSEDK